MLEGAIPTTCCRVEPALSLCALTLLEYTHTSISKMSVAAGSDSSHHSGDDSDSEGSVACSDKSGMNTSDNSRKRPRKTPQYFGAAWVFHGLITTEKALLHTKSDQGAADDDPFPKVAALLKAHWEGPCRGQESKRLLLLSQAETVCSP